MTAINSPGGFSGEKIISFCAGVACVAIMMPSAMQGQGGKPAS
jgi:hypothetical protein